MFQDMILESLKLVIVIGCLPLIVVALAGTVIAFVQASLQIQEQTLVHLLKLMVLSICAYFFFGVCCELLVRFTEDLLFELPQLGLKR